MDASQIIKLLQKQNTRYINRCQTVDASTLTWQNQIQSSKYIQGTPDCNQNVNCNFPTQSACSNGNGICSYGGQGKGTNLMTGSPQQFPSVYAGSSGSGSQVYTSQNIMLQKAGKEACGVPGTSPAPENSYVVLPACSTECTNTNYSNTIINNNSNPYLPQLDTYYKFKNPLSQCKNCPDKNQRHYVQRCHSRFPGVNVPPGSCGSCSATCDGCVVEKEMPNIIDTSLWSTIIRGSSVIFDVTTIGNDVYIIGYFSGTIGITNTNSNTILFSLIASSNQDVFIVKYNTRGEVQWGTKIGGTGDDRGYRISSDGSSVYVTGYFNGTATVYNGSPTGSTSSPFSLDSSGNTDAFIVKYDTYGKVQWGTKIGGTGVDQGLGITSDGNGIYVTGWYSGTAQVYNGSQNGMVIPSQFSLVSSGFSDAFIVKYDTNGQVQWGTKIGGTNLDKGIEISSDGNGIYVVGDFNGTAQVYNGTPSGSSTIPTFTLSSVVPNDITIFIVKYDTNGQVQWGTIISSLLQRDKNVYSISSDGYNIYISGWFLGTSQVYNASPTGTGTLKLSLDSSGNEDAFIVKYDTNGQVQWGTKIGGTGDNQGIGIISNGYNVFVCGSTTGTTSLYNAITSGSGPTTPVITYPFGDSITRGFLVKYDTNGNIV